MLTTLLNTKTTISGSVGPIVGGGDLISLYVRDTKERADVAVGGLEGANGDFLQTQSIAYAPLTFYPVAQLNILSPSDASFINLNRKSLLVGRASFSTSGAVANVRICLFDVNDVAVISESITWSATSVQIGGRYIGEMLGRVTYGAVKAGIIVDSISIGDIQLHLAGV